MVSTQNRGSGPGAPQAARGPNLAQVLVGGVKDPSPFPPHMMTRALPPGQGFRSRPEGEQGLRGFEGRRVFIYRYNTGIWAFLILLGLVWYWYLKVVFGVF